MTFDLEAIRARFPALASGVAFLDGPGGTQCPQSVIDAIAGYLRESNANLGGAFAASRRSDELVEHAHATAARFLGCRPEETIFGANMTTLNFALTPRARANARGRRRDPRHAARPRRQRRAVARARARPRPPRRTSSRSTTDTTLDLDDLERKLTDRTRVVAFPLASNAVGTTTDATRSRRARARSWRARVGRRSPLRAARADRRGGARRRRPPLLAVQVLRPASRPRLRPGGAPPLVAAVQGAAGGGRAGRRPLRDRDARARAARGLRRRGRVHRRARLGRDPDARARARAARSSTGLPDRCTLYGLETMDGRVPTFAFRVDGMPPRDVAERLADAGDRGLGRRLLRLRGDDTARPATRRAPSAPASSTTTRSRRSTGSSPRSPSSRRALSAFAAAAAAIQRGS